MDTLPESDWKIFRELYSRALERFCQRVLADVERISGDSKKTAQERYLKVYRLVTNRDQDLARAFDGPRRSQVISQLTLMYSMGLLEPEELDRFSDSTRAKVSFLLTGEQ